MSRMLLFIFFVQYSFGQQDFDFNGIKRFQNELNSAYANPDTSPLMKEDLARFKALEFYPISKKFYIFAKFQRTANEKPFAMKTSTGRAPLFVKYGVVHFVIDGKNFELNVYQNIELSKDTKYKDYLFLPFSDLSCGKESYIGGRYIDLSVPKSDAILIDFNKAYNPYCAYNHNYSCPKVPLENDLKIFVKAGVKKFHD